MQIYLSVHQSKDQLLCVNRIALDYFDIDLAIIQFMTHVLLSILFIPHLILLDFLSSRFLW